MNIGNIAMGDIERKEFTTESVSLSSDGKTKQTDANNSIDADIIIMLAVTFKTE